MLDDLIRQDEIERIIIERKAAVEIGGNGMHASIARGKTACFMSFDPDNVLGSNGATNLQRDLAIGATKVEYALRSAKPLAQMFDVVDIGAIGREVDFLTQ